MSQTSVVGSPYWVDYLSTYCLEDHARVARFPSFRAAMSAPWRLFASKNIIVLGHGVPNSAPLLVWFSLFVIIWVFGPRRPHFFMYWIGSEVPRRGARWQEAIYHWFATRERVHLICGAPWFVEALAGRGLTAHPILFPYHISPARALADVWPDESHLVAGTYLTPSHWENSNGNWITALCREWPDVRWRIIGMTREEAWGGLDKLENVDLCGWVPNPQQTMSECHVFLRLSRSDAYAGTARDAQAMRRIVFFTKPVGDCIEVSATNPDDCFKQFGRIVGVFAGSDSRSIASLRSNGSRLPELADSTKELIGYIRDKNA